MAAVTGTIAAGVAGLSTAASFKMASDARSHGRKANKAQRAINRLTNRQAKRQFLRNFRQAQAATLVSSVAAGVGLESSRVQGTLSSERSQADTAVREFAEMDRLGGVVTSQRNKQVNDSFGSNIFSSVSNIAQSFI